MTVARNTVKNVSTVRVPEHLPPAITRPRQLVEAVSRRACAKRAPTGARPWPGNGH
jgi:hypothetical protein